MGKPQVFNAKDYYRRQTVLAELGPRGQARLRHSKAVVIGLGGLGTISALYLALAGVGHLRLVDQDTVELNNLHRQVLYSLDSLHYPKVEAAAKRIEQANPDVKVDVVAENVRESNVDDLVKGMDCIVDGLDNMRTRYLLNHASVKHHIPYVFGAAIGLEGNLSVFSPPTSPCLECILPNLEDRYLPTCDTRGVIGATTGIIGSLQAMETIKLLSGVGSSLMNKLMVCDFKDMYFTTIEIFKRPDCPVCGVPKPAVKHSHETERLAVLCGSDTVNVNPERPLKMSLNEVYDRLKGHFKIVLKSSFVIAFHFRGDVEVTLFTGGRMLIKNVKDEKAALSVHKTILRNLGVEIPD